MAKEFKEKTITVNLIKTFNKPKTKRAKSAQHFLKQAITKETRIEKIKISNGVNETLWGRGLFNCPRKITVKIIAEKDTARVYLPDEKIVEKKAENKKETKTQENKTKNEETPKKETEKAKTQETKTEKPAEEKK
jgi:ribosomal protein L31E